MAQVHKKSSWVCTKPAVPKVPFLSEKERERARAYKAKDGSITETFQAMLSFPLMLPKML